MDPIWLMQIVVGKCDIFIYLVFDSEALVSAKSNYLLKMSTIDCNYSLVHSK